MHLFEYDIIIYGVHMNTNYVCVKWASIIPFCGSVVEWPITLSFRRPKRKRWSWSSWINMYKMTGGSEDTSEPSKLCITSTYHISSLKYCARQATDDDDDDDDGNDEDDGRSSSSCNLHSTFALHCSYSSQRILITDSCTLASDPRWRERRKAVRGWIEGEKI